ncbi:unnamed protein product [Phytophthora lilii]|uniref:Unnamed protein product n=1 Tax=Phytophthora lilii TaxID=2077276 RepID=A0A9W6TLX5_9STRA|nr:unnamed protein product [Phytophthora lilii]
MQEMAPFVTRGGVHLPYKVVAMVVVERASCKFAGREKPNNIFVYALDDRYSAVALNISKYELYQTEVICKEAVLDSQKRKEVHLCTGDFRRVNERPWIHELIKFYKFDGIIKFFPVITTKIDLW